MKLHFTALAAVAFAASATTASAQPSFQLANQQPTAERTVGPVVDGARPNGVKVGNDNVYIIQLEDAAVAAYTGGVPGLAATNAAVNGETRLDVNSEACQAYEAYLAGQQATFAARCTAAIGRAVEPLFVYKHAFNGMAVEITPGEAERLRAIPGVKSVTKQKHYAPVTDAGPEWIYADRIWYGYPRSSKGEGIVVAVLDSGINHDHPSFAAVGGDGYHHTNPLGSGSYIPGSYCDVSDPSFCNDKLIGAWGFVRGPDDPTSPEDSDGHGSHTAATAVGNHVFGATIQAPTTTFTRNVSGVAPHANIIAYDVCIDSCPGAALLAAVNQVVIDSSALPNGIHALNYSISGGNNPYSDAVELAFLNATAAGVYVAASAGNNGPGPATTGHNSPWVSATAAMTHNRAIVNTLTNITSGGGSLSDLAGAGLTDGYGPAPIFHASDFPTQDGSENETAPGQCLDPFPANHFPAGAIIVCDRGSIARVEKGANVLAGGAGGFVLANVAANGESINADPHFLPGVHIGFTDGETLRAYLDANKDATAQITGFSLDQSPSNGDIMAGFSSRGPNSSIEILKPDIGGPGVSVMAAVNTTDPNDPPEYDFLSGTSMSSPHNAGSGALFSAIRPNWTPYEIKSALMLAGCNRNNLKEDGMTPADPFDVGAGRLDLDEAQHVTLVLDETPANFLAADPAAGGDPKTLNIASMANHNCVGECSWTRRVKSTNHYGRNNVRVSCDTPSGIKCTVTPRRFRLREGQERDVTVTLDTASAPDGFQFASVDMKSNKTHVEMSMPIAVNVSRSTLPGVLAHTVSSADAKRGDTLDYQTTITNGQLAGPIQLFNSLGSNLAIVPGSMSMTVNNGSTTLPFTYQPGSKTLTWTGELDEQGLEVVNPAPFSFGYFSLAGLGIDPAGCPSNCDDGGFIFSGQPAFRFNGQSYTSFILSVNGTIEPGAESGLAASAANVELPSPSAPNNLIAPLWQDLNLGAGGKWYVATLSLGPDSWIVVEWENVPLFGNNAQTYTFQVWMQTGNTENIWFTYGSLGDLSSATVGVENADGTIGDSYWFEGAGTAPVSGDSLGVSVTPGGTATFSWQATTQSCSRKGTRIISQTDIVSSGNADRAIAVTECKR